VSALSPFSGSPFVGFIAAAGGIGTSLMFGENRNTVEWRWPDIANRVQCIEKDYTLSGLHKEPPKVKTSCFWDIIDLTEDGRKSPADYAESRLPRAFGTVNRVGDWWQTLPRRSVAAKWALFLKRADAGREFPPPSRSDF
jgi:hypothetical protein